MEDGFRSGCPINQTLEVLGDRWSLIVIRDIMFGNRRHFRELLQNSEERIASNILASRLKRLMEYGLLTRSENPGHKQKAVYSLTEMSISLIPILAEMGAWGNRFLPVSEEFSIRAQVLEEGGRPLWDDFMQELRVLHLGVPPDPQKPSVFDRLQAAYLQVVAANGGV